MVVVRGCVSGGAGEADPDAFGGAGAFHLFKCLSALLCMLFITLPLHHRDSFTIVPNQNRGLL